MLDQKFLHELREYIERHSQVLESVCYSYALEVKGIITEEPTHRELDDYIKNNRKATFAQTLFSYIDKKGSKDSDIYKRAGIDRRHFSKIRANSNYRPGKNTVILLSLALELNKKEASDLLSTAGYTLSDSDSFDLVIRFCLEKRIYDIHNVNQALVYFSLKPLAGVLE